VAPPAGRIMLVCALQHKVVGTYTEYSLENRGRLLFLILVVSRPDRRWYSRRKRGKQWFQKWSRPLWLAELLIWCWIINVG